MDQPKSGTVAIWAMVLTMLPFLSGCGQNPEEHRDIRERRIGLAHKDAGLTTVSENAAWDQERRDALMQLRTLRNGLYTDLASVNTQLHRNDLDSEQHGNAYALQVELVRENARLDSLITRVESSDAVTWLDVREDAHQTSEAVARWWNHLKENVDQGAPADNDGH